MATNQGTETAHELKAVKVFRAHLMAYIIINLFFWIICFANGNLSLYAWPAYPTIIWGVIILIHYVSAYRSFHSKEQQPL